MRKINKQDVFKLVLVLALVAGMGLAMGAIGRFVPTHKIVQPVYCGSCHPEQVEELNETTHLAGFATDIEEAVEARGSKIEAARAISGGCTMCHNYWDNFKWWGVRNFSVDTVEVDNPSIVDVGIQMPTDIYGNPVSPYGLGSTESYVMNVSATHPTATWDESTEPWTAGLDVYKWSDANGSRTRLDYVWSKLSSLSPGPVGFRITGASAPYYSCGTAEKGLCHSAVDAVALSSLDKKREFPEYGNGTNLTLYGAGTFFQHEMAFTTAQYAAKPVKICGACHVFKLPPMRWGGEPWAVKDVYEFSQEYQSYAETYGGQVAHDAIATGWYDATDPFGFRPTYNDLTGDATVQGSDKIFDVRFRTPDWAHANVPCIRCHVHAGINEKLVSSNEGFIK